MAKNMEEIEDKADNILNRMKRLREGQEMFMDKYREPEILKNPEVETENLQHIPKGITMLPSDKTPKASDVLDDIGKRLASVSKSLAEDSGNISLGFEDEEDVVNHPSHYETGKFECIEVMEEIYGREDVKAFCRCNAFKYLYRCKHKNGNQDIDKARWYINKYLDLCKEDGDDPDYPSLLHDVLDAYKKYDEEKITKEVEE